MSEDINLSFEEFKLLKDEAKECTTSSFRDLEIVVALTALFLTFMATKTGEQLALPLFWQFLILQTVTFLFLLTVISRVIYVQSLRHRLCNLEQQLNNTCSGKAEWESRVVPEELMSWKSANFHSHILLGICYIGVFLFFVVRCWMESGQSRPYSITALCQIMILAYLAMRASWGYKFKSDDGKKKKSQQTAKSVS